MYGDWRTAAFLAPTLAHKHFTLLAFQVQKILSLKLLLRSELFWQVMEGIARIGRYYLLSPRSLWDQWSRQISRAVYKVCWYGIQGTVECKCLQVSDPILPVTLSHTRSHPIFYLSHLLTFTWTHNTPLSFCARCVLKQKSRTDEIKG